MMSKKKIGFGIIGCGVIAEFHTLAIEECSDAQLVAVCDVDEDRAKSFSESHNVSTYCTSAEELANLEEVDAISICTPSGFHLDSILPCIEKEKHLLVEKPMEITAARIDQIIKNSHKKNIKVGGIFQLRLSPNARKLKKALDDGILGRILIADAYIKFYRSPEYYASAGWRGTRAVDGGGALMNQGIHYIDLLLWLVGDVKTVIGSCHTLARDIEVEDTAHALLKYKNGAVGVLEGTTCAYPGLKTRIEIHGEKGSVRLEDDQITLCEIQDGELSFEESVGDGKGHTDPKKISAQGHILQIQEFVDAILEDHEINVDALQARRSVAVIEAIYQSSEKNIPVDVSSYQGVSS